MKPIKLWSLILLILLSVADSSAIVRVLPTGASEETVNLCALRDKYGFLWVGTTAGLACFDGNGNPVNGTRSGIIRATSNQRITNIFIEGEDVWFTTPSGLMKYDRNTNAVVRFPHKTKYGVEISSMISNMVKIDRDNIWIATQGQGLFRYNCKTKTLTQDSRYGSFFTDITYGNDGHIYVASISGEIHKFTPSGQHISTSTIPGYSSKKTEIELEPQNFTIWIAGGTELYSMDVESGLISHCVSLAPYGAISSILYNVGSNSLLLGTPAGIFRYYPAEDNLTRLEINEADQRSFSIDTRINNLVSDQDGNVIVVSQIGGVNALSFRDSHSTFIPVKSPNNVNNFVYALSPANKGKGLWVGSDVGLNYYDVETGRLSDVNIPGLKHEIVTSLTADGNELWIGTAQDGLFLYNTSTGETLHFKNDENVPYSIISDAIINVFVTTPGETFVLTEWGICRYNRSAREFTPIPEIGLQTEVVTMAEYYDGTLWAATDNIGLLLRKPGDNHFVTFETEALDNSTVTNMLVTRSGVLWVATQQDGLFRYNKEKGDFERFEIPILGNRAITALMEDQEGTVWVASGQTLVKISKNDEPDFSYSRLLLQMPLQRSAAMLSDGRIAIGCNNGFQLFDPATLRLNSDNIFAFPTTITFPFAQNDEKSLEELGVNILLYTRDEITLPYDHNSFTIHLSATHPAEMPAINYDYMLEGVDKDWIVGSAQSEVTYSNLSPGSYTFMVRPSGVTNADVKTLNVRISPPWYMTLWAYLGYALILVLFGLVLWWYIRRKVRQHYTRRLESLRIQKERESWESKMRFFVDLVHEIRTPLMLIALPLEHIIKRFKEASANPKVITDPENFEQRLGRMRKYLGSMQNNLSYLLGITNELLDFRKIDNENENTIYRKPVDLNVMLEEICQRFEEPMAAEHKTISLTLPGEVVVACVDEAKTDRVLMNLIGNARKYSRNNVSVSLEVVNSKAKITIGDDGPGVPEQEVKSIFQLYYQIKDDTMGASLGTGLGLAYAKLIAQLHDGEIRVGTSPLGGAEFTLEVPLGDSGSVIEESELPVENDKPLPEIAESSDITLLVVDDNEELLEMISDGLENNYRVITARDGIEALEKLKENDVDFIVSDVMMPRMNGIELLQKVKGDINTSHIPFIILSAKTTHEAKAEGLEFGADIYLDKPFSIRNLILQIENVKRTRMSFHARRRGTEPLPVVEAAEQEAVKEEKLPQMNKYDREFLDKMNELMTENLSDEQFTIDVLAEMLNMSRSSFYRKLKALTGMTPVDYMKNFRLDAAAKQLREGMRVSEVVDNVGFASTSYFSKCFKDKYGVLPRDYK